MLHFNLGRDGFPQDRQTGHGRVLVVSLQHGVTDCLDERIGWRVVRKALPQVDGLALQCQRAHFSKNGAADVRQF